MGKKADKDDKKKSRKDRDQDEGFGLKRETKQTIYAIVAFLLAVFFIAAAFGGGGVAGSTFISSKIFLVSGTSFCRSSLFSWVFLLSANTNQKYPGNILSLLQSFWPHLSLLSILPLFTMREDSSAHGSLIHS